MTNLLHPTHRARMARLHADRLEAEARAAAPECPGCQTPNEPDARFCKKCGEKMPAAGDEPKKKPGAPEERAAGFGPSSPSARNVPIDRATCQRIAARTGRAVADVEHAARAMGFGPGGGK